MTQVPLKLDGKTIGTAEVDMESGEFHAAVTDPAAAAEIAAMLESPVTGLSIAADWLGEPKPHGDCTCDYDPITGYHEPDCPFLQPRTP